MKELNLLPENYRFDYQKYFLIKKFSIIIILNILLIVIISAILLFLIKKEEKILKKSVFVLNSFKSLNSKFTPYITQLKKMNKQISELENKKQLYFINYQIKFSPFLSFLILSKSLTKGININSINYQNGSFTINGISQTNKDFYNYYKSLKNNPYIEKVEFRFLKKDEKDNFLSFQLKIDIKELY